MEWVSPDSTCLSLVVPARTPAVIFCKRSLFRQPNGKLTCTPSAALSSHLKQVWIPGAPDGLQDHAELVPPKNPNKSQCVPGLLGGACKNDVL